MEFTHIELSYRPLKDGLHDSSFRFLRLIGVTPNGSRIPLHQWADHALFHGPVNIDVTRAGELRIMPWFGKGHGGDKRGLWVDEDADEGTFFSSAMFYANDGDHAARTVEAMNRIHREVREELG